jgi:hypothetical protein
VCRLLVTANVVPSSPNLVTLMMEELGSSETSVPARAALRNIPEEGIPHSHCCGNLKSYIVLCYFSSAVTNQLPFICYCTTVRLCVNNCHLLETLLALSNIFYYLTSFSSIYAPEFGVSFIYNELFTQSKVFPFFL